MGLREMVENISQEWESTSTEYEHSSSALYASFYLMFIYLREIFAIHRSLRPGTKLCYLVLHYILTTAENFIKAADFNEICLYFNINCRALSPFMKLMKFVFTLM
jgi:hypothetical protein